jgi:phosphoribosylamine--glycine ligase
MQEIILPTIGGLAGEGRKFQGVLFAGLMITTEGPKVLEFNARFGYPETQVIMARMRSDLVPLLLQGAEGQFGESKVEWAKDPAVCVVLASKGYPESSETGKAITGLESLQKEANVIVYHAATAKQDGAIVTVGGRVLGITALGSNLDDAVTRAYEAVAKVSFEGMCYRKDIGQKALARLHEPR